MPRPADPHTLIYAPSDPTLYPDWIADVGDRKIFRISGFEEFRFLIPRNDGGKGNGFATDERFQRAVALLNETGWAARCQIPRNPHLGATGIKKRLPASASKDLSRLSLYTTLIMILMLELYLADHEVDVDIYEGGFRGRDQGIMIVPYIFDVPEATHDNYGDILAQGVEIKRMARIPHTEFIRHMCDCDEMFSERTARAVETACSLTGGIDMVIAQTRPNEQGPKRNSRKLKSPCFRDKPPYPVV